MPGGHKPESVNPSLSAMIFLAIEQSQGIPVKDLGTILAIEVLASGFTPELI